VNTVYESMLGVAEVKGAGYVVLLDPDKYSASELAGQAEMISAYADFIFVGGSLCVRHDFGEAVKSIKAASSVPVVIFPGDATQVSRHADALLFLSLVSSRNADLLIGEHVKAAPMIRRHDLEIIPVAYMLIESGQTTSVQFMSQSLAIPGGKPEIAMAHALAGEYLGMKMVFLEAGSAGRDGTGRERLCLRPGHRRRRNKNAGRCEQDCPGRGVLCRHGRCYRKKRQRRDTQGVHCCGSFGMNAERSWSRRKP
jgi:phosphoglycerol geranylgeranyltransferase